MDSSFIDAYGKVLYIFWGICWSLVAFYYGRTVILTYRMRSLLSTRSYFYPATPLLHPHPNNPHLNHTIFDRIMAAIRYTLKLFAWVFFSWAWPKARKWDIIQQLMPEDSYKLQVGISFSSLSSVLFSMLFWNTYRLSYPPLLLTANMLVVILSCMGALNHLYIPMKKHIHLWKLLFAATFTVPIIVAMWFAF